MKDALGAVQSILVLGGTSEIGVAIAARLAAARHATVVLAGRHHDALTAAAATVRAAGAGPGRHPALRRRRHRQPRGSAWTPRPRWPAATSTSWCWPSVCLGDQEADEAGGDGAVRLAQTNYVGAVSAGLAASRLLRAPGARHPGRPVVGRRSAGATGQLHLRVVQGRRGRIRPRAWRRPGGDRRSNVLIVRPGFVHTKMTRAGPRHRFSTDARSGGGGHRGRPGRGPPGDLGPGSPAAGVFAVFRHLPRPLWRRLPGDSHRGVAAFDFDGTLVRRRQPAPIPGPAARPGPLLPGLARPSRAMMLGYRRAGRDGSKAALLRRALAGQAADARGRGGRGVRRRPGPPHPPGSWPSGWPGTISRGTDGCWCRPPWRSTWSRSAA